MSIGKGKNYAFGIFGKGCEYMEDQNNMDKYKINYYNDGMKYEEYYTKCYPEHTDISMTDRYMNPFNKPLNNFSREIRDPKSPSIRSPSITSPSITSPSIENHELPKIKYLKRLGKYTKRNLGKLGKLFGIQSKSIRGELSKTRSLKIPNENHETESLLTKVKKRLKKNHNVYIFGNSYGGLILNRLCQELQKEADKDEIFKEQVKKHFTGLTINSIMLADKSTLKDVNLINYVNIGDNIAMQYNRFETMFKNPDINLEKINRSLEFKYKQEGNLVWFGRYDDHEVVIKPNYSMFPNDDDWDIHKDGVGMFSLAFFYKGENSPDKLTIQKAKRIKRKIIKDLVDSERE